MSVLASLACQALISRLDSLGADTQIRCLTVHVHYSTSTDLHDPRADVIRRVFWHCMMMETYVILWPLVKNRTEIGDRSLQLEFGLPSTGLEKFDDSISLPTFGGPMTEDDYIGNQATHFQEHFASQIVLRSLSATIHATLSNCQFPLDSRLPGRVLGAMTKC